MRPLPLIIALALMAPPAIGGELPPHGLVPRLDISEWVGDFFADAERSLTISLWDRRSLAIDILLTPGLLDPQLAASGKLETIQFSVRIPEGWIYADNRIEFALHPDGPVPPEQAAPQDCRIVMRLDWNINWIDVTENGPCTPSANLTGRYHYRPLAD